jgi:hypothetical protein
MREKLAARGLGSESSMLGDTAQRADERGSALPTHAGLSCALRVGMGARVPVPLVAATGLARCAAAADAGRIRLMLAFSLAGCLIVRSRL